MAEYYLDVPAVYRHKRESKAFVFDYVTHAFSDVNSIL